MVRSRHRRTALAAAAILLISRGAATAAVDDDAARCRSAIALQATSFADTVLRHMITCEHGRMRGTFAADTACTDPDAAGFPANGATVIESAASALASRVARACADVAPAELGYAACPPPCDGAAPSLASFADVASCLACTVRSASADAVVELFGATPPVLGRSSAAERCQTRFVAASVRSYVRSVLRVRKLCQAKEDAGATSGVDCATADATGAIAAAGARLTAAVGRCSAADLALLTSCASSVAGEQSCARAAGDAMANDVFALVRPEAATGSGCAADDFLDLSGAPGAGPGYPAPALAASCTAGEVVVTSNSIPPYTFVQTTPNALVANQATYRFPRSPEVAASTSSVPLLGVVAVAVNGLPIFGPNEAQFPDPFGDPVANAILDECLGHTAFAYHYHALRVQCLTQAGLVAEPWTLADPPSDGPSPVIAYAFDGFPIYGPYECADAACSTVVEHLSSWDNVGYESLDCTSSAQCSADFTCAPSMIDGAARNACVPTTYAWTNNAYRAKADARYLDQCNGHHGPDGDYHYHATGTFPYVLGCYRGTPTSNAGQP